MENNKKEELLTSALLGAIVLIVLRELFDKSKKNSIDYIATGLLGGAIGVGVHELSRKDSNHKEVSEYIKPPDIDNYTSSIDNSLHIQKSKRLSNKELLYAGKTEIWFFDKTSQKVIVAADKFSHNGFTLTDTYNYFSKNCYSKDIQQMIDDVDGVFYLDFSADICAGLGITGVKAGGGFGIGIDKYNNIALYGNYGALASFLEHKASSYDSGKRLWSIILGAAASTGLSINHCPHMKTVKDLFSLSYTAEIGVGMISIRFLFDNMEHITGLGFEIGEGIGLLAINYSDSRNKGLIINIKEVPNLLFPKKIEKLQSFGFYNYEITKNYHLNNVSSTKIIFKIIV